MSESRSASGNEPAPDLFDLWMAPRRPVPDVSRVRPGRQPQTIEDISEFAHPAPELGGTAGAPPSLGPETEGQAEPPSTPAPSPVTTGASASFPPEIVLSPPRAGARRLLTVLAVVLALAAVAAGVEARRAPALFTMGLTGGLVAVLLLTVWARARARGTRVTIEDGRLKVAQGGSKHVFPLVGTHPQMDVIGEPGQRGWKVLIQRRGLPAFVITESMVDPQEFTEVLRRFRPGA